MAFSLSVGGWKEIGPVVRRNIPASDFSGNSRTDLAKWGKLRPTAGQFLSVCSAQGKGMVRIVPPGKANRDILPSFTPTPLFRLFSAYPVISGAPGGRGWVGMQFALYIKLKVPTEDDDYGSAT
jgi:hypothetical protein